METEVNEVEMSALSSNEKEENTRTNSNSSSNGASLKSKHVFTREENSIPQPFLNPKGGDLKTVLALIAQQNNAMTAGIFQQQTSKNSVDLLENLIGNNNSQLYSNPQCKFIEWVF